MAISFLVAGYFQFVHEPLGFAPIHPSLKLIIGVGITTLVWITVTLMTPPTQTSTLQAFYNKIRPLGPGWRNAVHTQLDDGTESLPAAFLCWFLGCTLGGVLSSQDGFSSIEPVAPRFTRLPVTI